MQQLHQEVLSYNHKHLQHLIFKCHSLKQPSAQENRAAAAEVSLLTCSKALPCSLLQLCHYGVIVFRVCFRFGRTSSIKSLFLYSLSFNTRQPLLCICICFFNLTLFALCRGGPPLLNKQRGNTCVRCLQTEERERARKRQEIHN